MARIRSIRPEFCTSLDIAELSHGAQLHFVRLWTYADDDGRGVDDPRLIKGQIWPLDDAVDADQVDIWQSELATHGHIHRYVVDNRPYFEIVNFTIYQRPQKRKDSDLPPAPLQESHSSTVAVPEPDGSGTGGLSPVVVEGEGVVEGDVDVAGAEPIRDVDPTDFELADTDLDTPEAQAHRTIAAALDDLCGKAPAAADAWNRRRDDIRQLTAAFARHDIPATAESVRTLAALYRADMTASLTAHGLANHADRLITQAANGHLQRISHRDLEDATRHAEYAQLAARKAAETTHELEGD